MSNQIKTVLLLGALTGLILFMGQIMGGSQGVKIALVLALAMNFFSYWYSDKIVLRLYRAQEVSPQEAPELHAMVGELAREAQVPMPRVYIVPTDTPNAFATGRNPQHAAVAVTNGILKLLSPTELKGVLAHEMGHVKNRDILIQTVAATLGGAITYLAYMAQWAAIFGGRDDEEGGGVLGALAMAILAPIAAMLIQMAISRSREYMADATGARLCHNPQALASALEKLAYGNQRVPMQANPSTAHMFIVNPLTGGGLMSWFSTHPPIEERVARLRAMRSY
ncbi:MAG: zinc metalloprotease HtpX [Desulfobacteraceae bacterium]